jgi:hypothetical protein
MANGQLVLPFGTIRNRDLFSSHWLEHRLRLEPEWAEARAEAERTIERLADIWRVQRDRVAQYGAEQPLEHAFIQPVLSLLGWKVFYQAHLRGREPDYALFATDAALASAIRAGRTQPDFWECATVVADAKAWHVALDRPQVINQRREYPPEQIEWYLDRSRLAFGVLTNGHLWRLIPRELDADQRRFQTYLECDLAALLTEWCDPTNLLHREQVLDEFAVFLAFFSPLAFRAQPGQAPLLERARKGSNEYRLGVGEDLKTRVFAALRLCVDGFLQHRSNGVTPDNLTACRAESFILLYRLLFVLYAEDRGLLPYRHNRLYTDNRSLGRMRQEIAVRLDRIAQGGYADYSTTETRLWSDLQTLFDLIDNGHGRYQVPQYNGGLFDDSEHPFLRDSGMTDWFVARVIDQLSRARDAEHPERGLFFVDYRDLRIQHLGTIYEGLLELHPEVAGRQVVDPVSGETVPAGHVSLRFARADRRNSGSFYTRNNIVDYIVAITLGPLCARIDASLKAEIHDVVDRLRGTDDRRERTRLETRLHELEGSFDDRVLRLRILDPAMGSGHFLLSACQYLAEEIATHPFTSDPELERLGTESALTFWKRRVVEHCLYGVDLNPLAVELAKLALWLETVATDKPLTFLDHHLRVGNSLVGANVDWLDALPSGVLLRQAAYQGQVTDKLPVFLEPLEQIALLQSDNLATVRQKGTLLRQSRERRAPFIGVANLWCATFLLTLNQQTTDRQYETAIQELAHPLRFARLMQEPWFQRSTDARERPENQFFHWELEFPEVFFTVAGRRVDAGFDAVIGNPPYDVVSELETEQDLAAFKAFIRHVELYAPSLRGKNNLYKLFICRALALLTDRGTVGFITPMPLLGDDQAAVIRRLIFQVAVFRSVDAFPQKDDPRRRVFPEAKLSTVVFTVQKTSEAAARRETFVSRVHPANTIEESSPSLRLSTEQIPLYDPKNLAIVSCSQEDWDLAVRIMQSGRLQRLGSVCASYQGEVNETNERPRGSLSEQANGGPLILRGASICLYAVRDASQGVDLYLNRNAFLEGKGADSKAYAFRENRAGFQRSSPQNNFRRIVAAPVARGEFCFDTVSYVPASESDIPIGALVALLNSKLLDWYFRLGSTNSKVNEYQFNNLPCPVVAPRRTEQDGELTRACAREVEAGRLQAAHRLLAPCFATIPFPQSVIDVLNDLALRIGRIERARGEIARRDRAHLAAEAQPLQDLIDCIIFDLAGLTVTERTQLVERLRRML